LEVYQLSRSYPQEERYGLTSQIQRASVSIPLNIAEGYGKQESAAEFKRYLRMALGSANEMEVLLDLSSDLGYLAKEQSEALLERYTILRKQLYRLGQRWS
jgi:four helix bundle protein